jgi:putative inorganic carbon (hco3(-)) transporter
MAEDYLASTPWSQRERPPRIVPPSARDFDPTHAEALQIDAASQQLQPHNLQPAYPFARRERYPFAFWLLLILNAVVFIRPSDLIDGLEKFPIYEILMLLTIFDWLRGREITRAMRCPSAIAALCLWPVVILSHLSHVNFYLVRQNAILFAKPLIYFFMVLAYVKTPSRMRLFLKWMTISVIGLTALGLLDYLHYIDIPALAAFGEVQLDTIGPDGNPIKLSRLCSVGIFNDPNDLSLMLCVGFMLSLYWLHDGQAQRPGRKLPWRLRWAPICALFLYAIQCTHSRGGLIALMSGLLAFIIARYGLRRTLPLCAILAPAILLLFSGRQTNISTNAETAQDRIHLWSSALEDLRSNPMGIGMNQFVEQNRLVTHNSYLQAFAELGFIGGSLFLGAFVYSIASMFRLRRLAPFMDDPALERFHPYLLGGFVSYAVGFLTLSRDYVEATYLMLALVAIYLSLADACRPGAMVRMSWKLVGWGVGVGATYVVIMYLFVNVFAKWSH